MSALPGISAAAAAASARSFTAESLALFDAMSVKPDHARSLLIDATIRLLMAAGIWSKLDLLYVLAAHDAQAARLNWKLPGTFSLVDSGAAPTFTADEGFTSDGSTQSLRTGLVPGSGNYQQNSAHRSIYVRTSGGANNNAVCGLNPVGSLNASFIVPRNAADNLQARLNAAVTDATANADGTGLFTISRTGSANYVAYRNASALATLTETSTGVPDGEFSILANGATERPDQVSFHSVGRRIDRNGSKRSEHDCRQLLRRSVKQLVAEHHIDSIQGDNLEEGERG